MFSFFLKEKAIKGSSNLLSSTKCNYVDCNSNSLVTIKCGDASCNNWFHHIYQNEYNCAKYNNGFESMHNVKKCCRVCVDKIMETLSKSVEKENKHIQLIMIFILSSRFCSSHNGLNMAY